MLCQLAKAKVEQWIKYQHWVAEIIILDEYTTVEDFWWVFHCQSKKYLLSQNVLDRWIMGPVLIHKLSGEILECGTAYDYQYYIRPAGK